MVLIPLPKKITLIILIIFIVPFLSSQEIETEPDTTEFHQEIYLKYINPCLDKVDSWRNDFIKFREFFVSRSLKYTRYSNFSLFTKIALQVGSVFLAAYSNSKENLNIPWVIWGVAGGIPLSLQLVETFGGNWQNKSKIYQELSIETGALIRRIEVESYYIRNFAPMDSTRAFNYLLTIKESWDSIITRVPEPLRKKDVEGITNDALFKRVPRLFE
jgi:hypothetical protein